MPVFNKFKDKKPDVNSFAERFGENMRSLTMTLEPLTGSDFVDAVRGTARSSASLDNWQPASTAALAWWCPMVFNDLALISNQVEECGPWHAQRLGAYISLIPKDDAVLDVSPVAVAR